MGSWGISENATPKEKLKSEMADFLGGLNSCGEISYSSYSEIFDFSMDLLDKIYELGKIETSIKEEESQVIKNKCDNCEIDCPDDCKERTDRCPNCDASLNNDLDWEFDNCPYCGQKLKY